MSSCVGAGKKPTNYECLVLQYEVLSSWFAQCIAVVQIFTHCQRIPCSFAKANCSLCCFITVSCVALYGTVRH
jgi:hypothetical protein